MTSGKKKKFVKRMEAVGDTFKLYDCNVTNFYDSYDLAKEMLPKILRDSDLSSQETPRRKKPRVTSRTLPIPPVTSPESFQDEPTANLELNSHISHVEPVATAGTASQNVEFDRQPTFVLVSSDGFPVVNNDETPMFDRSNFTQNASVSNNSFAPVCASSSCAVFQKDVTDKLEKIYQLQKIQGESINAIMGLLKASRTGTVSKSKYRFPAGMFPIRSTDQLVSLNALIESDPEAYEELVSMVRLSGGSKIDDGLKLASKELISDEVLSSHCYKGQSDKVSFLKYGTLLKGFQDGLNQNSGISDEASKEKMDKGMSKILKLAADRVFQRKRMMANKSNNTEGQQTEDHH